MKSLVKKVVFGALFLMNVGLVCAHPPVDLPEDVVPTRVQEIASELHKEIVSPFEERKAKKKSEIECKFKEEYLRKIDQISLCIASGDKKKLKAMSANLKSWYEKRSAELKHELKDRFGEIECKAFSTNKHLKFQMFTTDIPQCILDRKALKYTNFCPKNGYVVYGNSGDDNEFGLTSMDDILVRGPKYSRTMQGPGVQIGNLPKQTCLLLDNKTWDFIKREQPGWKPASVFTVDGWFNIGVCND